MPTAKNPTKAAAKKPAAKTAAKTPAPKADPPHEAEGGEADAVGSPFVLSALHDELKAPDPVLLAALLQDTPDAELLERGTRIASGRVVSDGARMLGLGWTFYKTATPEQRRRLRGCTRELFALAVDETLRLEQMMDRHAAERQHEGGLREVSAETQTSAWDNAIALRDQAAEALRSAAGSREGRSEVSEAVGNAESGASLARGLEALAKLLEGWLQQGVGAVAGEQAIKVRLGLFALDAAYAKELRAAAETLRQAAAAAKNRPQTARVAQIQLDRQDGLCLLLIDRIMRAYECGHALDPLIPRLVPIATRVLLGRSRRPGATGVPDLPAPAGGGDGVAVRGGA